MKRIITLLTLVSWHLFVAGQDLASDGKPFEEASRYLQGADRPYNPELARKLLWRSASTGDSRAMVQLGLYYGSPNSLTKNSDSAIYWFKAAARAGTPKAWFLLGRIYQLGIDVKQDFSLAAEYYRIGISHHDNYSKNAQAYLHFKGLGIEQDYSKAFRLFSETAAAGLPNSMYFLGVCYRNGYGTPVDQETAKTWLRRSALEGEPAAMHELTQEQLPENVSAVSSHLQEELKKLSNYTEKFQADKKNNYEGTYTGVAIYYDWSGRYVSEILPLELDLTRTAESYTGQWREGNSEAADISLTSSGNKFTFSPGSAYTRNNHYSARKPEKWQFNNASLGLAFIGDSIQLSGFVQFYSPNRSEPGKPLQIILKKKTIVATASHKNELEFSLAPNPATSQTSVRFTLQAGATVAIKVYAQSGALVYTESPRKLPAGNYNFTLPVAGFTKGTYTVQLTADNQSGTRILVRQ